MLIAFIVFTFAATLAPCLLSDRKRARTSHARKRALRICARARFAA